MLSPRAPLIRAKRNGTPRTHAMLLEEHGRQNGCAFFSALRPQHAAPRGPPYRSSAAPLCFGYASGGGQTWRRVGGFWLAGWLVVGRAERVTSPPRLASLGAAPQNGGRSGEDLGGEVRVGALMKPIADLEAPKCKTPTFKKPRDRPTPGGSAEGAGGLSSHSAKPITSPL